jgi:signal transduction histidine kinase
VELSGHYKKLRHLLHDLAQPLATITGLIDLLLLELKEGDRMFQEVNSISQQLEKVLQIIEEVQRIAREAAEGEMRTLELPPSPLA